jgi:N-acylneuraminate cytidylyltransferase
MNDVTAFIFARGGSKGLPGKNIKLLGGKPLIAWSIETAHAVAGVSRVIVSTDCPEISAVAKKFGAEVPFLRPSHLSDDTSPEWLAWRHALEHLKETEGEMPDMMLSLPATAPLRSVEDVNHCLNKFHNEDCDVVVTMTDAHRSPYFNMVKGKDKGLVELVISPKLKVSRRQDSPVVYDMATVAYVMSSNFIMNKSSIFEGNVAAVHVPPERAVDIDTIMDFKIAELFLEECR